jgi:dynein heavy chain
MYGGHVVEDWDRRLTSAYLQTFFQEGLLEGQLIIPKFDFRAPTSNMNHRQV